MDVYTFKDLQKLYIRSQSEDYNPTKEEVEKSREYVQTKKQTLENENIKAEQYHERKLAQAEKFLQKIRIGYENRNGS